MTEVFNAFDCRLALANGSGTGDNWASAWRTAAGATAQTAIIAYVRTLDVTSAFTNYPVPMGMGDNRLGHHKNAGVQAIGVNMGFAFSGEYPNYSAFNASVPMVMGELMHKQGTVSSYWHFMGISWPSVQFTVNANENMIQAQFQALAMLKTGSGYIMT